MDDRDALGKAKDFAQSEVGKSVIAGAAIGVVASLVLPVGMGLAALVGGGYGAYRKLKK